MHRRQLPRGHGCEHVANTAPCDDGDPCTLLDHCEAKACKPGAPM
ncbi:MAG: hypothetical protein U1F43_18990 [Myxococcota bacterium]